MTTTTEAVEAAMQYASVIPFYSVPEKIQVFQQALNKIVWHAADGESAELATIRTLAARVRELEREQSQDGKRLDFLLHFISVDDVGDECVALGICVNHEAMEEALGVGKKDESGRSPLLVKSWDDNIREVIDRAIESHGHPKPKQAKQADEVLYGLEGQELLDDDLGEIVSRILENYSQRPRESFDVVADRIPWPVKVFEFRRVKVSDSDKNRMSEWALENAIEWLNEDYSGPDGVSTNPTAPMQLAARRFVDEVVQHYKIWNCEPTGEVIEITRELAKEIVG